MQVNQTSYVSQTYTKSTLTATLNRQEEKQTSSSYLDKMQEKYKDVFTPYVAYSEQNEQKATAMISEKYPFYLTPDEEAMVAVGYAREINTPDDVHAQKVAEVKQKVQAYENLDDKTKEEFEAYKKEVNAMYPSSSFPSYIENHPTAVNFYNGAVYEALESGYGIDEARDMASSATSKYMPEEMIADTIKTFDAMFGNENPYMDESQTNQMQKQTYADEEVRKYGLENSLAWKKDDDYLANAISNQIKTYEFLLDNPDIYEQIHEKHPFDANDEENNQKNIQRNYQELGDKFLPMAQIAQKVFENYNVYGNSLDMSA